MLMRTQWLLAAGMLGLVLGPGAAPGQDTFPTPPNALALEDTGTLERMQANLVKFRDSNNEPWLLQIVPQTTVSIEAEADADYLEAGQTVELTGKVNADTTLAEPIKEIEVLTTRGRVTLGLFPEDGGEDARPVREPEAGTYRIRGRIADFDPAERAISIQAGRWKISGKAGEELKVTLTFANPSVAQPGDSLTVKAWYYDQGKPNPTLNRWGKALAEEVNITLAKPPESGKRSRGSRRSVRGDATGSRTSR